MNRTLDLLVNRLRHLVGDKRYMRNVEEKFKTMELTPEQTQALNYLIQDLNALQSKVQQLETRQRQGRFF
jgi:cell shape-determining protein MreC